LFYGLAEGVLQKRDPLKEHTIRHNVLNLTAYEKILENESIRYKWNLAGMSLDIAVTV